MSERNATRQVVLTRARLCEAAIPDLCGRVATDVHEIKTRARGGSITDPDNCLSLCRPCHRYITEHPTWALENGYVVHGWATEDDIKEAVRKREAWRESSTRGAP